MIHTRLRLIHSSKALSHLSNGSINNLSFYSDLGSSSIRARIFSDLKAAMKANDSFKSNTLKLIYSELNKIEKELALQHHVKTNDAIPEKDDINKTCMVHLFKMSLNWTKDLEEYDQLMKQFTLTDSSGHNIATTTTTTTTNTSGDHHKTTFDALNSNREKLLQQLDLLKNYLPPQKSLAEIESFVENIIRNFRSSNPTSRLDSGKIMKKVIEASDPITMSKKLLSDSVKRLLSSS